MYLICRRNGRQGPLSIVCWADCDSFVSHYIKHNVTDPDRANYVILKAEEVNINMFIDKDQTKEPCENCN